MLEFRPVTTSFKAMAIKANFTKEDVKKRFDAFLDMVEQKQIARLQRLGEMCLTEARNNKGYMMQTGALTSSTGYQVFVDGVAIHSQFDAASGAESEANELCRLRGSKGLQCPIKCRTSCRAGIAPNA